jgi:type VI secretion system protein ImpC
MPLRSEFTLTSGSTGERRPAARGPLRLLLLGDFSAQPAAQRPALASRPTRQVDIDNLDAVLASLAPQLPGSDLAFTALDDFHPDQLYARLARFEAMRQARQQTPSASASASASGSVGGGADLLGQLLGQSSGPVVVARPATATPASGLDGMIQSLVAPHIIPDRAADIRSHQAAVDSASTEQMRKLLHEPAFQALEAAWRGVHWLVANLELGETLELHLFDVTQEELLADVITAQGQLAQTGLHRTLADRWRNLAGGQPWHALLGLYQFGPSDADIGLLAALGLIAAQAGGPLLAGALPALADPEATAQTGWPALRRSEAAPWIGLAASRVLLRLPYGQKTDPLESFAFEEFDATPVQQEFLWGHGALALGLLLGRSFTANGWAFEPGDERDITDLPAFTYRVDGEPTLQACAERYLSDEDGRAALAAGLMPLLSHRHRNAVTVTVPRFQSVADPAGPLAGLSASA